MPSAARCGSRSGRSPPDPRGRGRVVVDRNRVTGGGVTAGIDFGLRLAATIAGETVAQAIQLGLEYDPEPPFRSGHPDRADPALVAQVRARLESSVRARADLLSMPGPPAGV